ncbi:CDP-alcohol phosphatidyltransferase family protein [Streptomyces daliensis]
METGTRPRTGLRPGTGERTSTETGSGAGAGTGAGAGRLGLYALKPWYARRLTGVRMRLVALRVPPDAVTWTGVAAGAAAGATLALAGHGVVAGLLASALLALRLACANLDGALARDTGRTSARGAFVNELGDRLAEFAVLAGCAAVAPWWLVALAALAATLPSWVSLASAAAGGPRLQGGPVGKTERCALLAAVALTGWSVPLLTVLAAGSVLTAALRCVRVWRAL